MTVRAVHRLSPGFVQRSKKPGMHCDGGNLYLQVTHGPGGNVRRSWVFRFQRPGHKPRDMGMGNVATVPLALAREMAAGYRRLLLQGLDPIEHRDAEVAKNLAANAVAMTFDEAAKQYMAAHRSGWRSIVHAKQWETSLAEASPVIGKLDVAAIDTAHVMRVLEPMWSTKLVSASRLRGRIESVLDWARARGYRDGENPARWKGHLKNLLARPAKDKRHLAAMAYVELPGFMRQLRQCEGIAALALEFTILVAGRTGEVLGANWGEVNLAERVWVIAGDRMKAGKEHRVPLSPAALAALQKMREEWGAREGVIFANPDTGRPVADQTLGRLIRSIGAQVTTHGFRSTFRDWAGDRSNFPREIVEAALAHKVGDAVEQAYRRSDALEKRRRLMEAWASYCSAPVLEGAKVVSIGR
jgi:integrase